MKPKFDIPLQVSREEINALVRLYGGRLHRDNSQDEAEIMTWLTWNAQRLVELVALLGKSK